MIRRLAILTLTAAFIIVGGTQIGIAAFMRIIGGIATAVATTVSSVTGQYDISCSPTTGAVLCNNSITINAQTGTYAVLSTDAGVTINENSKTDATVTLPTSGTFATGVKLSVANVSNATAVPVTLVGTPVLDCAGASGSSCNAVYTVVGTGHEIKHFISLGGNVHVTGITDGAGDTCGLILNTKIASGTSYDEEQWSCPNSVSASAQTFAVALSGSATTIWDRISEYAGAALVSPDDQGNATTGTSTAPTLATAGTMSVRGELITASFNQVNGSAPTATPGQTPYAYNTGGFGDAYLSTSGAQQYTFVWKSGGAIYLATVAGIEPAHPVSVVTLCPGSGTTLIGTPTSSGCTPLPAGFSAQIIVASSTTYQVTVIPPAEGYGPMDDLTASANLTLLNCREPVDLLNFLSASPIVVTAPVGLPSGCTASFVQGGSVKAQFAAGTGMAPLQSGASDVYSGGQYTQANMTYLAGGGAVNLAGTISATSP